MLSKYAMLPQYVIIPSLEQVESSKDKVHFIRNISLDQMKLYSQRGLETISPKVGF